MTEGAAALITGAAGLSPGAAGTVPAGWGRPTSWGLLPPLTEGGRTGVAEARGPGLGGAGR